MWRSPRTPFAIKRNGIPIRQFRLTGAVDPNITFGQSFAIWEALIAAGATIGDLLRLEEGRWPNWFIARVLAWHNGHRAVKTHTDDAVAKAQTEQQRRKR
jgi:hypothetical protein